MVTIFYSQNETLLAVQFQCPIAPLRHIIRGSDSCTDARIEQHVRNSPILSCGLNGRGAGGRVGARVPDVSDDSGRVDTDTTDSDGRADVGSEREESAGEKVGGCSRCEGRDSSDADMDEGRPGMVGYGSRQWNGTEGDGRCAALCGWDERWEAIRCAKGERNGYTRRVEEESGRDRERATKKKFKHWTDETQQPNRTTTARRNGQRGEGQRDAMEQ